MEQQTHPTTSLDTINSCHARCSSLLLGDPKQVGLIFLKSTLTRKLQELFFISFRKISTKNHSASVSRLKQRHRDCMRSIQQSDKKAPPREKSQTERHSTSSFQILDDSMVFSEDVKVVLHQINKYQRLTQIVDADKRIKEVVVIESNRLQKIRNSNNKLREKIRLSDSQLAINCIDKLLRFIGELSIDKQQILGLKCEIDHLQQKLQQNGKPTKQKDGKTKGDQNSIIKQTSKAVDTLITIMRDHKVANIKRKIDQESKKFTQTRRQLFQGILASISKAEVSQQSNLSQITQLSSKLLQEQPSIQKNIAHIEKQKRIFEKILNQSKCQENKAAYYNLIDTSIYLAKLFNCLKQKEGVNNQQISRIKSPPRIRKPITSKTATKQKLSSAIKSRTPLMQPVETSKMQQSYSKEQNSLKNQLSTFVTFLQELKMSVLNETSFEDKIQSAEKQTNEDFKKIVSLFYQVLQHSQKEGQDLKDFIQTLSFDIQTLKKNQQNLEQVIQTQKQSQKGLKNIIQTISKLISKNNQQQLGPGLDYQILVSKLQYQLKESQKTYKIQYLQQQKTNLQALSQLCSKYLGSISFPLKTISPIPREISNLCPQLLSIFQIYNKVFQDNLMFEKKYLDMEHKFNTNHQYLIESSKLEIQAKNSQVVYLKNTIQNLTQHVFSLKKQISDFNRNNTQTDDLRFQINLLKSQNNHNIQKHQEIIQTLQSSLAQVNLKNKTMEQKLQGCLDESKFTIQSIKQQHFNQRHDWELETIKYINREKEFITKITALESDIFLYKREITSFRNQFDKNKSEMSQQEMVNSLREQNAILREDVIEKAKMIEDLQTGQKSPKSLKCMAGSMHNITDSGETSFKKKNTNSSVDVLKEFRPFNQEITRLMQQKTMLEAQIRQMKQKIGVLTLQKTRDEGIITELRKQVRLVQFQLNNINFQNQRLKREMQDIRKTQVKLKQRLREYQIEEGSIIMKNNQKWNNQLYVDSLDGHTNKSISNHDDRATLLKKIDFLQGQLYNQGSKLLKTNAMREQDLRILMSENQLLQEEVKQINAKLVSERVKLMISPKILQDLEDSMRKMQFQLSKLKHEGTILKDELRNVGNPETSYIEQLGHKPAKSSYEFVTTKFSSRVKKNVEHPASPKNNRFQGQVKQLEKEKESLVSRVKLLSVFTIIDEQNKAFVHNINKIISSLLEFLSVAEQFQECDYSDVDFMSTLSQYLSNQDYQGYFQTLETFFKDLFLNVFERKNVVMAKQTDQLLFLKDKMQQLLSEKIDEIQQQEQKLTYAQRTPLKNYNQDKSKESISHLQHLFKLFLKFKDPKILKQICQALDVTDQKECY